MNAPIRTNKKKTRQTKQQQQRRRRKKSVTCVGPCNLHVLALTRTFCQHCWISLVYYTRGIKLSLMKSQISVNDQIHRWFLYKLLIKNKTAATKQESYRKKWGNIRIVNSVDHQSYWQTKWKKGLHVVCSNESPTPPNVETNGMQHQQHCAAPGYIIATEHIHGQAGIMNLLL